MKITIAFLSLMLSLSLSGAELKEKLSTCASNISDIKGIDFSSYFIVNPGITNEILHVVCDNPCFFYDQVMFAALTGETNCNQVAYNGKLLQVLQGSSEHIQISTTLQDMPTHMTFPILLPFTGFSHSEDTTLSDLYNLDFWENIYKNAKVIGDGEVGGLKTTILEIKPINTKDPIISYVQLANDLNYYPIEFILKENSTKRIGLRVKVDHYKVFKFNGKNILIPISIGTTCYNEKGEIKDFVAYAIKEDSIKLYEKVPIQTFSIDPTKAKYIMDLDNNTHYITTPDNRRKDMHPLREK